MAEKQKRAREKFVRYASPTVIGLTRVGRKEYDRQYRIMLQELRSAGVRVGEYAKNGIALGVWRVVTEQRDPKWVTIRKED